MVMTAKIFEVQIMPTQQERANLSPGQKTFNQLIQKIQRERERLEAWNAVIPMYQQKYLRDLKPLLDQIREHKLAWLRQMDHLYLQQHFTKNEKVKLSAVICDVAEELLQFDMLDELKEIYNRHNPQDYDEENQEQVELLKARFSQDFDYEFSDEEQFDSPEDVLAFMRKKMKALAEEELAAQDERKLHKKKSAKVLAAEDAEAQMQRSLREVFRKLVQDLHPDREQDPLERERKNALMQRVNAAYEAGDLLTLFELQVEIAQIDQAALQAMNDERLQNYNKILPKLIIKINLFYDNLAKEQL